MHYSGATYNDKLTRQNTDKWTDNKTTDITVENKWIEKHRFHRESMKLRLNWLTTDNIAG